MKKMKFIFALTVVLASAAMLFTSCNQLNNEINNLDQKNTNTNQSGYVDQGIKFNPSKTYDTMTDNDGNVYKTITLEMAMLLPLKIPVLYGKLTPRDYSVYTTMLPLQANGEDCITGMQPTTQEI
jgi:hypothetical protein